jgi:predicted DNA-binding protein
MRTKRFSKPLTIALNPEAFDQIKQITDAQARSMADWVREAVDQALRRQETDLVDVTKQSAKKGGK